MSKNTLKKISALVLFNYSFISMESYFQKITMSQRLGNYSTTKIFPKKKINDKKLEYGSFQDKSQLLAKDLQNQLELENQELIQKEKDLEKNLTETTESLIKTIKQLRIENNTLLSTLDSHFFLEDKIVIHIFKEDNCITILNTDQNEEGIFLQVSPDYRCVINEENLRVVDDILNKCTQEERTILEQIKTINNLQHDLGYQLPMYFQEISRLKEVENLIMMIKQMSLEYKQYKIINIK
jgi:hypothetical protein